MIRYVYVGHLLEAINLRTDIAKSSWIEYIGYAAEHKDLRVITKTSEEYSITEVPHQVVTGLLFSESLGKFWNQFVKPEIQAGRFKERKLEAIAVGQPALITEKPNDEPGESPVPEVFR